MLDLDDNAVRDAVLSQGEIGGTVEDLVIELGDDPEGAVGAQRIPGGGALAPADTAPGPRPSPLLQS